MKYVSLLSVLFSFHGKFLQKSGKTRVTGSTLSTDNKNVSGKGEAHACIYPHLSQYEPVNKHALIPPTSTPWVALDYNHRPRTDAGSSIGRTSGAKIITTSLCEFAELGDKKGTAKREKKLLFVCVLFLPPQK